MATTITQTDILHHPDFVAHVGHYAAKATAALPTANGRVVKAVDLVLNGCVVEEGAGRWAVASAAQFPEAWYTVTEHICTCKDFVYRSVTDPAMVCGHIIATWLYRRVVQAIEKEESMSIPDNTCTVALDTDGVPCHAVNAVCPGHPELSNAAAIALLGELDHLPASTVTLADTQAPAPGWTWSSLGFVESPPPAPAVLPEAAASANTFILVNGHRVQITLRDFDETRLMQRMIALLADYAPAPGK